MYYTVQTKNNQRSKFLALLAIGLLTSLLYMVVRAPKAQAAACTPPTTDYGTVTMTVTIPETNTYKVWSRMMVPDTTNNTFLLEIDGNACYNVGGSGISANTWKWVDYHKTASGTPDIITTLSAGNHTFKAIGNKDGVKLDKIIVTSDTSCTPTGTGSNCESSPPEYPYDNKIVLKNDGTSYYVENGRSHYIDKGSIRDCIAARRGTGAWVTGVADDVIALYSASSLAYCNYEQEPGLNFIREDGDPTVWLVRSGGTKQHVGTLCVVDAYTTIHKKFRVHVVPFGETAGHTKGADFFGNPTVCGGLPG